MLRAFTLPAGLVTLIAALQTTPPIPVNEMLWDGARSGDRARVMQALDQGADVNAKTRYGATALLFAADRGHLEIAKLLVERGADVNAQDSFYKSRPIDMALFGGHMELARYLLGKGSRGGPNALNTGIRRKDVEFVKTALASPDVDSKSLIGALALAKQSGHDEITALVKAAIDARPGDPTPTITVDPALLRSYAGSYRNESTGVTITVNVRDGALVLDRPGQPTLALTATAEATFIASEQPNVSVSFRGRGGMIERAAITQPSGTTLDFERVVTAESKAADVAVEEREPDPKVDLAPSPRGEPRNWPSFRGPDAAGVADRQGAVVEWDVTSGKNIKWKTPIPGIANSSPIVWGDRIFVTTAITHGGDKTFRTGLYGDVRPVNDLSEHTWKVYSLDKKTGRILWEQTSFTGVPKVKRHTKASQANSTPATDGRHVVVVFGSIGLLMCYDANGKLLWKQDIGVVDSGWFFDPTAQWGHSSSPVIYKNSVIVQVDQQKNSFLAAYKLNNGKELWRAPREDEVSTWGTPTVHRGKSREELVTNGTKIRGYDPNTGRLLWTLAPNSEITVATPVASDGLIYVTAGYPPVRPIYAIKPGSSGDISLPKGASSSEAIAWSSDREGTYIPTPLVYGEYLYTVNNNGILTAYQAKTGERALRARVGGGGSFSSSPVAADGRLYLANEDGDVFVLRAGASYQELAKNTMKDVIMATPAISDGVIVIRTLSHVYGIGQ